MSSSEYESSVRNLEEDCTSVIEGLVIREYMYMRELSTRVYNPLTNGQDVCDGFTGVLRPIHFYMNQSCTDSWLATDILSSYTVYSFCRKYRNHQGIDMETMMHGWIV